MFMTSSGQDVEQGTQSTNQKKMDKLNYMLWREIPSIIEDDYESERSKSMDQDLCISITDQRMASGVIGNMHKARGINGKLNRNMATCERGSREGEAANAWEAWNTPSCLSLQENANLDHHELFWLGSLGKTDKASVGKNREQQEHSHTTRRAHVRPKPWRDGWKEPTEPGHVWPRVPTPRSCLTGVSQLITGLWIRPFIKIP